MGQRKADIETTDFIPGEQELNIIFDFPDGRVRPIVRSVLYVDGDPVTENIEPPFDQFIWNIEDYRTNGSHTLQVEVKDSLGLTGRSAEIPVEISFELPEPNPWAAVNNNIPVLSGLAILLAGGVLVLVLIMGGRLRPRFPGKKSKRRRKSDPVTQPVTDDSISPSQRFSILASRLKWSKGPVSPQAYALLTVLSDSEDNTASTPIPIITDDLPIGSDPNQAILVLDDPSIEELHAHLRHSEDGTFRLADEDTIAGTWINYTPVSKEGTKLEHGDLIHIGRVGFRFSMRDTTRIRKPIVTPEN
ncbi:FHA domain-containing protein [Chloroflexota bacterium]